MNIADKLGLEPIGMVGVCDDCHICGEGYSYQAYLGEDVRNLEDQRNEMLDMLIKIGLAAEQNYAPLKINKDNKKSVFALIEKIIGKSWEEVKEVLNV